MDNFEVRVRKPKQPGVTSMEIGSMEIEISRAMAKKYGLTKGLEKLGRALCKRFDKPAVHILGVTFNRRLD